MSSSSSSSSPVRSIVWLWVDEKEPLGVMGIVTSRSKPMVLVLNAVLVAMSVEETDGQGALREYKSKK